MVRVSTSIPLVSKAYSDRLHRRKASRFSGLWDLLDRVKDPEIPVLSLWDLGVLSSIEKQGETLKITITPTYSGCPAMETMRSDIADLLHSSGFDNFEILTSLSPAWTTDWLSPEGHKALQSYGIAPPLACDQCDESELSVDTVIACPHCGSLNTKTVSEFGSTACKSLHQCNECHEAFDYFKKI